MTNEDYAVADVTEEFLNELPERSLVQVVTGRGQGSSYAYFEKYGRQWLELDPSDRDDGEYTNPSGYLIAKASGFGRGEKGRIRVLFDPRDFPSDKEWN